MVAIAISQPMMRIAVMVLDPKGSVDVGRREDMLSVSPTNPSNDSESAERSHMPGLNWDKESIIIVLWVLAAFTMLWTWLPALFASLGATSFRLTPVDRSMPQPKENDAGYMYWHDRLIEMGYESIGHAKTRLNWATEEWTLISELRLLYHRKNKVYAVLQKQPPPFSFWGGVQFATCWGDGALLMTDNNIEQDPDFEEEFVRQGLMTLDLNTLQELHLRAAEVMHKGGRRADSAEGLEVFARLLKMHAEPRMRYVHGRAGTQYLFLHLLIHMSVSAPALFVAGWMHWAAPVTNLVLAFVMRIGETAQKRSFARAVRQVFNEQQKRDRQGEGQANEPKTEATN
jgi:hypothetical protein